MVSGKIRWINQERYVLEATVVEVGDPPAAQANPCAWGTAGIVCNGEIINYVPGGDANLVKKLKRLKVIR